MRYFVRARGGVERPVDAPNWLMALGMALDALGDDVQAIDRLACEVLHNGTVLARDARSGRSYVVRPEVVPAWEDVPALTEEDDEELVLGDADDDTLDEPIEPHSTGTDPVGRLADFDLDADSMLGLEADLDADTGDTSLDEITEPNGDVAALVSLLATLDHAQSVGEACSLALDAAHAAVSAEAGAVALARDGGSLELVATTGPKAGAVAGMRVPAGAGVVGFCHERRLGLHVAHVREDARFYSAVDHASGFSTRGILCVPVVCLRASSGCLQLLNAPSHRPFRDLDLVVLHRVARTLAEALDRLA